MKALIRGGASMGELQEAIREAVRRKPERHLLGSAGRFDDIDSMAEIGG